MYVYVCGGECEFVDEYECCMRVYVNVCVWEYVNMCVDVCKCV